MVVFVCLSVFSYKQGRAGQGRAAGQGQDGANTRPLFSVTDKAGSVWCLSVWAVLGRFFQSLLVPCGASPDVTFLDVMDSIEKRNQGQSYFLRQKIWQTKKKIQALDSLESFSFFFVLTKTTFFFLLANVRPD